MRNTVLVLAIFAAVAVLIVVVARSIANRREPISPDGRVIAQLAQAGDDPSKPREIQFFLYLPTKENAEAAAKELESTDFQVQVGPGAPGPEWLLCLTRSMRPVEVELEALRGKLSALAERHGGVYDGWGCSVVPHD